MDVLLDLSLLALDSTGDGAVGMDDLLVNVDEVPTSLLVVATVFSSVLLLLARTIRASKVDMHFVPTPTNKELVQMLRQHTTLTCYKPPRILVNSHTSTLFAALGKRPPVPHFHREHLETPDGGLLGLDILEPPKDCNPCSRRLTVFMLPGIAGDSDAPYIRSLACACHRHGWRAVVMNWRGCKTPLTTARTFTYGNTVDVEVSLRFVQRHYPACPITAVAVSMGANVLTKYMGTTNEDPSSDLYHAVDAAVTYSNGYLLRWGYEMLKDPSLHPYHSTLLNFAKDPWREFFDEHFETAHLPFSKQDLLEAKTMWEYDCLHVPAIYGYKDLDEFVEEESSGRYMHRIQRPFLTVNARNDPLFPHEAEEFVKKHASTNENIVFVLTEWGGHVGWDKTFFQRRSAKEHHNVMDEVTTTFFAHVTRVLTEYETK